MSLGAETWPDDVPVLTAGNLSRRGESADGKRKGLDWWLYRTFDEPCGFSPIADRMREALLAVISERSGSSAASLCLFLETSDSSQSWLAACWNEALARNGYEVPAGSRKNPGG